jgi:hypothetical protein
MAATATGSTALCEIGAEYPMELVSLIHETTSTVMQATALMDVPMPQHAYWSSTTMMTFANRPRSFVRDGFDAIGKHNSVSV